MRLQRLFTILLLGIFSICHVFPDNHKLFGNVKQSDTKEFLSGTTISNDKNGIGTFCDSNGYYEIMLPDGDYTIKAEFVGYKTETKKVSINGKDKRLDFLLDLEFEELEEVTITKHKPEENIIKPNIGTQHVDALVMKKMPSLMGEVDVIKVIQMLPGVQSAAEGTSGFSVRGGKTDQNLILLDNACLYNASHMLGFFSIFNNDVVDEATLLKGDIPAQYGGRLSSVLKVDTKEAFTQKIHGSGGIGLISSRLMLDFPIVKNKTSMLVAARRTYADLFLPLSKNESLKDTKLFFYDLNAKISHKFNGWNKIYWSGYIGTDKMGLNQKLDLKFGNTNTTIRWNHLFNRNTFSDLSLVGTKYDYNIDVYLSPYECSIDAGTKDWTLKYDWKHRTEKNDELSAGLSSTLHRFNQGSLSTPESSLPYYNLFDEQHLETRKALEHGLYASYEKNFTQRFLVKFGLRLSLFQNIGEELFYKMDENHHCVDTIQYGKGKIFNTEVQPEPRIGLLYKLTPTSSIKAAYTQTVQYAQVACNSTGGLPFDIWFPTSPNVKPQKCKQWSVGYFRNFADNKFETSAELFFKKINNVIDFKDDANIYGNEKIDGEIRTGSGHAYGIEILAKKNTGRLTGWISYTYAHTYQKIEEINFGEEYRSPFDRPHNLTAIISFEFTKRLSASANWVFISGQPCTNPYGKYTVDGTSYAIYTGYRNQSNYPNYHRLDLSLTWKTKEKKKWESEWNLSVYNAYARHNTWAVIFTPGENNSIKTSKLYLFSFVPSISYNFKF